MNTIDAHQHYWQIARGDYGWLTPQQGVLYRDFMPEDLRQALTDSHVTGTVVVQAAPTEAETRFLLDLARQHAEILGVIGWVDFEAPGIRERIRALVEEGSGKLKGLRPMVQDISDPGWLSGAQLDPAFEALLEYDLVFEALVKPVHLDVLLQRLRRHPGLNAVLNHVGKPDIAARSFEPWARHIEELAEGASIYCKLSGLLTEAEPGAALESFDPYVAHVFACFGPERVMWGSDWPVVTTRASYREWFDMARKLVARHVPGYEDAVFRRCATRCYQLDAVTDYREA
jgi:L-fuconolactonase